MKQTEKNKDVVFPEPEAAPGELGRLLVETDPSDSRVRILNIKPRFQQGIELKPGEYLVEVSAEGYITYKETVTIHAGETKTLNVALEKIQL